MTLWALLRQFRRRYLWASEVYKALSQLGPLSFEIQANRIDNESFQSQVETRVPDQDLIT